jgi:glycosyltransferase involved in cell wall biosynthesis
MSIEVETDRASHLSGDNEDKLQTSDFVSVVLPCLNEEASVGLVVDEALRTLENAKLPGEVLVVDNGSSDRSVEVARLAGARVVHEKRRGYGRALRTGIEQARGAIVVMADADWSYDMTKLPMLVEPILRGDADIAIGSRLHEATRETMPLLHRYVGTPVLTALVRRAGGYDGLPDSQSGFRCFQKRHIAQMGLSSDGMEFASEMLIKGSRHQLRVINVPTGYRQRIGASKLNTFRDGWRHLRLILLLAPELLLLAPGGLLLTLGLILSAVAFLPSRGIAVGSLYWQPVFFASIVLVLGLQSVLVGLVFVWRRASLTGARVPPGLRFVRTRAFPRACTVAGAALFLTGLGVDALLFARWVAGVANSPTEMPLASIAQSLLLVGGSLGSFGLIVSWLHWDERQSYNERDN